MKFIIILILSSFLFCTSNVVREKDMYIKGYKDGLREGLQFKERQDSIKKTIGCECK